MNSFFNSVRLTFDNREAVIKDNLIKEFSENVKEIQYENKENATGELSRGVVKWILFSLNSLEFFFVLVNEPMKLSDCTNSMCNTLEAIFLHGLKDSFLRQTISVLAGGEIDRRPEPNFWPPLLVILHKETITQVSERTSIVNSIFNIR